MNWYGPYYRKRIASSATGTEYGWCWLLVDDQTGFVHTVAWEV